MLNDKINSRLAVLIDADNANSNIISNLLAEVAKYGTASVKRIYGDWTTPNLGSWKKVLLEHSIQPIQQFRYTTGKNATDSAMIIDAMDLLYTDTFSGFCIVSSDSDFTRLASRIREKGNVVYGFGEKKTPKPFVTACDKFIYIENLGQIIEPKKQAEPSLQTNINKTELSKKPAGIKDDKVLLKLISSAIEAISDDTGSANLSAVGSYINKQIPEFDARTYGFSRLSDLVEAMKYFTITKVSNQIYLKDDKK